MWSGQTRIFVNNCLSAEIVEVQLSQRDRATLYVSKFMLLFTRYGS